MLQLDLATERGALAFAEKHRAEMVRCWQRQGRYEANGFSYGAYLFGTHAIIQPEKRKSQRSPLEGWGTGKKLARVTPVLCRLPRVMHDIPDAHNMRGHTDQREAFAHCMRAYGKLCKAVGVLFMVEAWLVQGPTKEQLGDMTPEQFRATLPDDLGDAAPELRRESLVMILEHTACGRLFWRADIQRNPDRVLEWVEQHGWDDMIGRMTGLVDWRS